VLGGLRVELVAVGTTGFDIQLMIPTGILVVLARTNEARQLIIIGVES
jgi:hypothetical protein